METEDIVLTGTTRKHIPPNPNRTSITLANDDDFIDMYFGSRSNDSGFKIPPNSEKSFTFIDGDDPRVGFYIWSTSGTPTMKTYRHVRG